MASDEERRRAKAYWEALAREEKRIDEAFASDGRHIFPGKGVYVSVTTIGPESKKSTMNIWGVCVGRDLGRDGKPYVSVALNTRDVSNWTYRCPLEDVRRVG